MRFVPASSQLRGMSYETAELYGKPHIGAFYQSESVKSHKKAEDAVCTICSRRVQSVHHVPPLSKGNVFKLVTPENGTFLLRPSLFALCGSGTTGCHNDFHGGARFEPFWLWHSYSDGAAWWSGELLKRFGPHSPKLYEFGEWIIHDKVTGNVLEVCDL